MRARCRRAGAGGGLLLLGVLACRGEAATEQRWQTVVDTIGDTVVVRTVGASDSAAALRLVPELRVGDLDGADEYQFAEVEFVLPAPAGGVYAWDRTLTSLRQYDSTGAFVRRIGGKGGGPGEYEAANGVVLLRDGRLVLWDPRNGRMNVYDPAGAALASWRFPSGLFVGGYYGLLSDTADNVYAMHWFLPPDASRRTSPEEATGYVVLGPDGIVRDSVLPPPAAARPASLVATNARGMTSLSVPFAPRHSWTISPHGYVVSGVGDRYAVTLHRPGAPLRIERDVAPVPVSPDERADAEERVTAQLRRRDPSWRWNGPPIPDRKPMLGAIRVAADGRVWVQRPQPGERVAPDTGAGQGAGDPRDRLPPRGWREPVAFDVYADDGRFLGFLRVPERTELTYMRGDHAWGVERDSLDVPYVVRFRIEPSPASRSSRQP